MQFIICLFAAMLFSSMGFKKYIWFISIGYGFAITGIGITLIGLFHQSLTIGCLLACLLFMIYGLRLGGYLAYREMKSASYNKHMTNEIKDGKDMSFFVKCMLWITCALLYVCETSPVLFRLLNQSQDDITIYIGVIIMVVGLVMETLADIQKNHAKKINPKRFVDRGLYSFVRCPNYLGEMLFWTGTFIIGLTTLNSFLQWLAALVGYIGIVYVMFSGARRLEIRQNKNYGNDPVYQKYVKTTPIMIPFIPLYSVEKYKFLVG